jgi:lysozyme family protein
MDNSIDAIWNIVALVEGGYVNDPKDPGGETKFGISARAYPKIDIKNLTSDDAKTIFLKDFFYPTRSEWFMHCNRPDMALYSSAFAFNSGVKNQIRILQRLINQVDSANQIVVDGVLGAQTNAMLETLKEPVILEKQLDVKMLSKMASYYSSLEKFNVFGRGWINRLSTLMESI